MSAGWCNGNILASHAADRGSIPSCGRSASHQTVSGSASAGDAHFLVRRTNPPTASSVPWYGVAQGYRKGNEHLRQSQKMGATWPCILLLYIETTPELKQNQKFRSQFIPSLQLASVQRSHHDVTKIRNHICSTCHLHLGQVSSVIYIRTLHLRII